MNSRKRGPLLLTLFFTLLLACGGSESSGSKKGPPGGQGAGGMGGHDGQGGAGGAAGHGGTGGTGGAGGTPLPSESWIEIEGSSFRIPLHGSLEVAFEVDWTIVGDRDLRLELDEAPKGIWLGSTALEPPGDEPPAILIPSSTSSSTFHLGANREVQDLEVPHLLRLRAISDDGWSGSTEIEVETAALVTSKADSGDGSLRDMIESAPLLAENPTIAFDPHTFTRDRNDHEIHLDSELSITRDLRIEGAVVEGRFFVTLVPATESRLMKIEGANFEASGIAFAEGRAKEGGPDLHGDRGGCIWSNGSLRLRRLGFYGCQAERDGGAIYVATGGTLQLERVVIRDSRASVGAAIASSGATSIVDSYLLANTANTGGGAVEQLGGTLDVRGTTFFDNRAEWGGAIRILGGATTTIVNSTFNENHAGNAGGAITSVNAGGTTTIAHSTIAGNASGWVTGGIQVLSGTLHLRGSVITDNEVDTGPNLGDAHIEEGGTLTSGGYNFLGEFPLLPGVFVEGDMVGSETGFEPKLGNLGTFGGNTPTFLPGPGSVLIDAIPRDECQVEGLDLATDQRGEPRPSGAGCDIGSVEVQ